MSTGFNEWKIAIFIWATRRALFNRKKLTEAELEALLDADQCQTFNDCLELFEVVQKQGNWAPCEKQETSKGAFVHVNCYFNAKREYNNCHISTTKTEYPSFEGCAFYSVRSEGSHPFGTTQTVQTIIGDRYWQQVVERNSDLKVIHPESDFKHQL